MSPDPRQGKFVGLKFPNSTKALLTIDDLILNAVSPIYLAPVEFWNVIIAKNGVHQQLLLLAGPCRGALIIGRWINAVLHLADRRDRKRLLFHFHESCSPQCAQRLDWQRVVYGKSVSVRVHLCVRQ